MRILTKYILRQHVPPFLFALSALTILLLLEQLSERFGDLVGKGLDWHVIAEVFVLSIPFILAMTLPMAVLVAVLYTFNRLASDNEITAMKANGVHLPRLLLPMAAAAALLAGGMVVFNNTILPESNHRLQNLLTEINQKKPTFALSARTVNEVKQGELYLRAGRIDRGRSMLRDVAIYDQRRAERPRTIYADSGHMAYSRDRTDLYLTLYRGVTHQWQRDSPASYQRIFFDEQILRVPDVTNRLQRGRGDGYRGDREMSMAEMQVEVDSADARAGRARRTSQAYAWAATRHLLGDSVAVDETRYLDLVSGPGRDTLAPAAGSASAAGAGTAAGDTSRIGVRTAAAFDISELRTALRELNGDPSTEAVASRFGTYASSVDGAQQRRSRFAVEIQKKVAIPVACLVFVLIGAPIAIRYPLGGVGMVVGVSFAFFCAYYVALVGGEELADRLILSPFWAMWTPNVLFGGVGLGLVWRAVRVG